MEGLSRYRLPWMSLHACYHHSPWFLNPSSLDDKYNKVKCTNCWVFRQSSGHNGRVHLWKKNRPISSPLYITEKIWKVSHNTEEYEVKIQSQSTLTHEGGMVASWLVRSSPDRAVRVRTPAGDIALCSWARHFTVKVPLFTQVYKWEPTSLKRLTSIPFRG